MHTITVGDKLIVLPSIEVGGYQDDDRQSVSNYVISVPCTLTITNETNDTSASINEDVYLTIPEGLTVEGITPFADLTKSKVQDLVARDFLFEMTRDRLAKKLFAQNNNATEVDAPWKE